MNPKTAQNQAIAFSQNLRAAGKIAVIVALVAIAITSFFTPSVELKEWTRIAGLALILVGGLAYGLGLLVHATNKSSHAGKPGPNAGLD